MRGKFSSFHKASKMSHHGGAKGAQSSTLPARGALNALQTQVPMTNLIGNYAKATPGPDQPTTDDSSMSASPTSPSMPDDMTGTQDPNQDDGS